MRKSVVVRNNCQSTYRFVEKAPKGKVFQLHSALLLNVSNISSKKTKTFVGDIELRSRPVTCTAKHSGPFLMKKFAKLDFWTKTTLSTPVLFFFIVNTTSTWSKCKWKSNFGLVRVKSSRKRRNVSKNGLVSDRNIPPGIPVPFFLQDFFNLSLLPDSVFCAHFLVARTDLCKIKVDKNPERNLPDPSFADHLPWPTVIAVFLMLMEKQLVLSRSDSKAGILPIWKAWLTGLVRWTSTRSARVH